MNGWLALATVLLAGIGVCGVVAALRPPSDGLVAMELAGVLATLALLALSEGFQRQPFGDLALVSAVGNVVGSLAFARFLERGL